MLNINLTLHREFLPADAAEQKLFVMLKLRPTKQVAALSPPTTFAFVIDTSGSMNEVVMGDSQATGITYQADGQDWIEVKGGNIRTKKDIVREALLALIHSGQLSQTDRVAIIQFDDKASTIIGLTPATEIKRIEDAIAQLGNFSGGTLMGRGLQEALSVLGAPQMTARRALLFTDGQTFDEEQCRDLALTFSSSNIPITALGVGDFNEDLLNYLSDATGGRPFHVVTKNPIGGDILIAELPNQIAEEFALAQQEVITNLALTVKTVKGVKLTRLVRSYPSQAEFPLHQEPYHIGNAIANDETIFILEFTIEKRPASRIRIAQLGLTYDVPGQNRREELPPQEVVVQFVAGQSFSTQVDREVMDYVQQSNVAQIVAEATKVADKNPQRAEELLETARRMTQRIGNETITASITVAQDELRKTRKISAGTRKTIKMSSKGKTVKMGNDISDELSDEQIRKISGT